MKGRNTLLLIGTMLLASAGARAHCDGLDGPVVRAARQALAAGDPAPALIWVRQADEPALREAFGKTLAMRKLGPQARDFADTWFFETLVRLHRAGEGAAYTGLKPAGRDLGPAIPEADRAVTAGEPKAVIALLAEALDHGALERFRAVSVRKNFDRNDIAAGREYVKAYVEFLHYVERVYEAARGQHLHEE